MEVPKNFRRDSPEETTEAVLESYAELQRKMTTVTQENVSLRAVIKDLTERAELAESVVDAIARAQLKQQEHAVMLVAAANRNGEFH